MSTSHKPSIGFIGLGQMGFSMASRLLDTEYTLNVFSKNSEATIAEVTKRGATEAPSVKTLAASNDIVMVCVDSSKSVESIVFGEEGVLAGLKPGTVVIDFGTSLPESTRKIGDAIAEKGAHYLDAPLGRTPAHAKQGLLNIIAAGEKSIFDQVEPVLQDLGENVFFVGDLGSGHTLKLINNFFGMTLAASTLR